MRKRKLAYPCIREAEKARSSVSRNREEDEPDFIGNAPNYDKFKGWSPEEVLMHLNVD